MSGIPFITRLYTSNTGGTELYPLSSTSTTSSGAAAADHSDQPTFWDHLPASFRTGPPGNEIKAVNHATLAEFLKLEFSLDRLDAIYGKLWRVGAIRPARSLNAQLVLGRTIVLNNSLDMHLVWGDMKIFLKPLPRYLLEPAFWARHLPSLQHHSPASPRSGVRECALGLLYTYACLVNSPLDFELAVREGLIPRDGDQPSWTTWRKLATELLEPEVSNHIHRRFRHGELRLNRLNWINIFSGLSSCQMYHNPWHTYTEFAIDNMAWITTATVYLVVVLTAMQVGLSTDALKDNDTFQRASYGFTVFSILGPLVVVIMFMLVLLVVVVQNWLRARRTPHGTELPVEVPSTGFQRRIAREGDGK
ncbi:hypothetical protein GCG54_00015231 [Colletotrichum gloeosporioides]|uniref:Subtilisin-like serine protease n=1 Tax=Colletotrichum gloeosporioides TaxID=474922 RepID=A0A8H4FH45_COLGL|nr:uncharacterized protein GCG54_00015231 [Colletotrichum gloeosporioides]KAF3802007.1 hypothetical protein GCG54_00015231 [Colletotrichum gloeosporioides]